MNRTKLKKILRGVVIIIGVFIIIGALVNWYVSNRLDNYLNDKLAESVSEATNGFYTFSFDTFSVGFFSGELSIQGVKLKPDSAVFSEWAAIDSLPKTFFNIDIGSIDFKGTNLKWRINYSDLDFEVFEVQSPHIEIFDIYNSRQYNYKTKKFSPKDLYETVSPYINVLTVKQINFEDAFIAYNVEDSISKTVYKLDKFSFHALGFRLDENSASSGKLLYSDNFSFIADTPQELLSNSQLILKTNNIELNTQDSVIQIDNIKIVPLTDTSLNANITEDYIEAEIKAIAVRGIAFEREEAQTFLTARSFDILSTDIHYCSVVKQEPQKDHLSKQVKIAQADSLIQNWSLYGMISPILHSIVIKQIKIADAKAEYRVKDDTHTDIYKLDKFDFMANNFKIDSAKNDINRFKYSDSFAFNATGIHGYIPGKNHDIKIGGLFLNTDTRQFEIADIKLKPLSTKTRSDYMFGTVKSIKVEGLGYNTGIDAELLKIDNPRIDYTMIDDSSPNKSATNHTPSDDLSQSDVMNLLNPVIHYLAVKKIDLKNAYFSFNDKIARNKYKLDNFTFNATDFIMDENTRRTKKYYFSCQNLELRFSNFDNILPGKNQRLKIREGVISAIPGYIYLKDVNLTPLTNKESHLSLKTDLIDITGIDHNLNEKSNKTRLRIDRFNLVSPQIGYTKLKYTDKTTDKRDNKQELLNSIDIGTINITDADWAYTDKTSNDSLKIKMENLFAKGIHWSANNKIGVADFVLHKLATEISQSGTNIISETAQVKLTNIDWGLANDKYINAGKIDIQNPNLVYHKSVQPDNYINVSDRDDRKKDLYSSIASFREKISINDFNLSNANGEFIYIMNRDTLRDQMINTTNLGFSKLKINTSEKSVTFENFSFDTKSIQLPIADGFYTLKANDIQVNQQDSFISINKIHLDPRYPKMEFAYKHPTRKDWFDVNSDNVTLSGIDFLGYFKDNTVKARNARIENTVLRNFKNQQIEIEHNIMPFIYEGLQKAPVKIDIDVVDIMNFNVDYQELAKKGTYPGKIPFRNMNGKVRGLTNIASRPNQYIWLSANGIFLDNAPFEATWMMPVSPENDKFFLDGHIHTFDLKELNQIIVPLASAEVKSGIARDVTFRTEATSKEAVIDMAFLYNDLEVTIYKDVEEDKANKFISGLANLVIRNNNPRKEGGKPHTSNDLKITRDPYHSTFNYFWQILKPATVEAVGVSKTTQDVATGISGFFKKVKNFFTPNKKKDKQESTAGK